MYDRRWRRYVDRSVSETLHRARIDRATRVLDVGCGSGALLSAVVETWSLALAVGVDLSTGMIGRARQKLSQPIALVVGDAEALPFAGGTFDAILSSNSFHFWPNRKKALLDFRHVLTDAGRIVITDWCDDFVACRLCDVFLRWTGRSSLKILSSTECRALLADCGFTVVSIDCYKISWLWGLMTVVADVRPS